MDRHWFPAILLGCSVLLALTFAVVLSPEGQNLFNKRLDVRQVSTPATLIDTQTYRSAVTSLLEDYRINLDAEATYNALIAVRVPADSMNLHYELVIALAKIMSGQDEDGQARLSALKAQYPWLPL